MISRKIDIWENEEFPGKGVNGVRPTMDTYILDGQKKRGAVLICPGGGYFFLSDREAEPIALQFNAAGYHAFVLYYSIKPTKYPQPLLDVSRAMCIIREKSDEWNICPDKVAVCGFSAGGHLAACLGVHWGKPYVQNTPGIKGRMIRPDALILGYPRITSIYPDPALKKDLINILGTKDDYELQREISLELHVSDATPPSFIWHTCNDEIVPVGDSLMFTEELRKKNVPFELHIYSKGPHGLALANAETDDGKMGIHPHVATWVRLCVEWLESVF